MTRKEIKWKTPKQRLCITKCFREIKNNRNLMDVASMAGFLFEVHWRARLIHPSLNHFLPRMPKPSVMRCCGSCSDLHVTYCTVQNASENVPYVRAGRFIWSLFAPTALLTLGRICLKSGLQFNFKKKCYQTGTFSSVTAKLVLIIHQS